MPRPTIEELSQMYSADELLHAIYLDYVNNYLTVEGFSDQSEIPLEEAKHLLDLANFIANKRVSTYQAKPELGLEVGLDVFRMFKDIRWPLGKRTTVPQQTSSAELLRRVDEAAEEALGKHNAPPEAIEVVSWQLKSAIQMLFSECPPSAKYYTLFCDYNEKKNHRHPSAAGGDWVSIGRVRRNDKAETAYIKIDESFLPLTIVAEW